MPVSGEHKFAYKPCSDVTPVGPCTIPDSVTDAVIVEWVSRPTFSIKKEKKDKTSEAKRRKKDQIEIEQPSVNEVEIVSGSEIESKIEKAKDRSSQKRKTKSEKESASEFELDELELDYMPSEREIMSDKESVRVKQKKEKKERNVIEVKTSIESVIESAIEKAVSAEKARSQAQESLFSEELKIARARVVELERIIKSKESEILQMTVEKAHLQAELRAANTLHTTEKHLFSQLNETKDKYLSKVEKGAAMEAKTQVLEAQVLFLSFTCVFYLFL